LREHSAPDPELYRAQLEAQNEELRQAQSLLEESRDRYAALYDYAPVGYVTLDRHGVIRQINSVCAGLLELDRVEAVGLPFSAMVVRSDLVAFNAHLHRAVARDASVTTELRLKRRSGETWHAQLITVPVSDAGRETTAFWTVITDITERKRAKRERERLLEEVRSGREQLKTLSGQLIEAHEAERRRLALELHDEIGQTLTGLKLMLDMSLRLPPDAARERLGEAQGVIDRLITLEEELSLDLRPSMLDNLGLLPALLWHFDRFTRQTNIHVRFRHNRLDGRRFGSAVETAASRIVQEAMTNVARYAGVDQASVTIHASDKILYITIQDRGVGFDPALMGSGSIGLSGMRERALLLDGQLSIESAPGQGVTINAELPLPES
jgi:PAS domain S-box-containing protein